MSGNSSDGGGMAAARRLTPAAARQSADVWAWCALCQRWFYPHDTSSEAACPVCATPAEKTAGQPET